MADPKQQKKAGAPPPEPLEPSSGPRPKGQDDDIRLLLASFKMRVQGLDAEELESEIERLLNRMVDLQVKAIPEKMRPEARELLHASLRDDPTLGAMIGKLREGARRG
jgi:hypothetical protein